MAIDVIAGDYHGKVVLRDQKSDGSVVLLVCEKLEPTTVQPTGPAVTPEPEGTRHDDGFFPIGRTQPIGVLELDVSESPSGINQFDSQRFSEAAIARLRLGQRRLRVGFEEAQEFGFREGPPTEMAYS